MPRPGKPPGRLGEAGGALARGVARAAVHGFASAVLLWGTRPTPRTRAAHPWAPFGGLGMEGEGLAACLELWPEPWPWWPCSFSNKKFLAALTDLRGGESFWGGYCLGFLLQRACSLLWIRGRAAHTQMIGSLGN
jgi:hypothetical protein